VGGKKHVFCSTEQPLCVLRVRRFARYLKIACLLHWHGVKYDPSSAPSKDELNKVVADQSTKGKWEGWGYYYSLSNKLFRSGKPYYFDLDDALEI